jgi:hypothetical protein
MREIGVRAKGSFFEKVDCGGISGVFQSKEFNQISQQN